MWLAEALKRRYGISTQPDASKRVLALETTKGKLLPLLEDLRGRSFRTDERLRKMDVELLVRRYEAHPMLQVVRIQELRGDQKLIVDYWCDICSIVMFEEGFCACCQADNRMRKRDVKTDQEVTIPK